MVSQCRTHSHSRSPLPYLQCCWFCGNKTKTTSIIILIQYRCNIFKSPSCNSHPLRNFDIFKRFSKEKSVQECIPVGCVPPDSVTVSTRGWGDGGGGSASGSGGDVCLWVRGCLRLGPVRKSASGFRGVSASRSGGVVYHNPFTTPTSHGHVTGTTLFAFHFVVLL